eukprot:c12219_g1_i1.p1 GENE.c12219_g1_i1~~c12219_g1_i1.p1  ORF type:complete len:287 (+),score=45.64 c12219_g1_i1:416-1276(+)
MLSLATLYTDNRALITMWSSGTGMAGVFGYLWVITLHTWLEFSFRFTLNLAHTLTISFFATFLILLLPPPSYRFSGLKQKLQVQAVDTSLGMAEVSRSPSRVTINQRFKLMLSLWPYTVPLFVVYVSEYMLQAGVWSAMGYPVTSKHARQKFYQYANWLYQAGVFVSRSSGTIWNPSVPTLWVMPILQTCLLVFFFLIAFHNKLQLPQLTYPLCFVVGLFGGAVYVNAFKWIAQTTPPHLREIALSGASVADTIGVATADGISVILQACLYQRNGIDGAIISSKIC